MLTIDANQSSRVFTIGDLGNIELSGLTITGSNSQGVYKLDSGTFKLIGVVVYGNTGVGVSTEGTLIVTGSVIADNAGGGILGNHASMTIAGSMISGNSTTGSGGGIRCQSESSGISLINSTVSDNTADKRAVESRVQGR
jgi:predicted outer membrane repeat protein